MKKLLLCAAFLLMQAAANAQDTTTPSNDANTQNTNAAQATTSQAATNNATDETATEEPEIEVVVTPTRNVRTLAQSTSAITVVTRRQIEEEKPAEITDVLRLAPGVSIAQSGTFGKQSRVFLRGASPAQTLVLIDGVRVNVSSFGGFDFGGLSPENIERIEVLRGPQSALYGSDAMGGVINIITRRGSGDFKVGGKLEFGNYSTNRQVINGGGEFGDNRVSFSVSRYDTDGFFQNDDFRNLGASLRLDHALSQKKNLAFTARLDNGKGGTPGQINPDYFAFDPDARSENRQFNSSIEYSNDADKRRDRVILGLSDRRLNFRDEFDPLDFFPSSSDNNYKDRTLLMDAQTSFNLGKHILTVGGELRRDSADLRLLSDFGFGPSLTAFSPETTTRAFFIQDEFRSGKFTLVPGLRYEKNSQFGSDVNGRLAAAYQLSTRTKVKASYGTGFRAPSFDQLYFPGFSNPNLQPEKSRGFDVGVEHEFASGGLLEVNLFHNKYRDLISFGPAFIPINVNSATTKGAEIGLNQPLGRDWRLRVSQTFLRWDSSGTELVRRPKYTTAADLIYRRGKVQLDLGFVSQGSRYDIGPSFAPEPFDGYSRFDLTASYEVKPNLQAYVRAQNIGNKNYEEVAGFRAPKFNFVVGLQTGLF
jgi:vitamin B12 transporter